MIYMVIDDEGATLAVFNEKEEAEEYVSHHHPEAGLEIVPYKVGWPVCRSVSEVRVTVRVKLEGIAYVENYEPTTSDLVQDFAPGECVWSYLGDAVTKRYKDPEILKMISWANDFMIQWNREPWPLDIEDIQRRSLKLWGEWKEKRENI